MNEAGDVGEQQDSGGAEAFVEAIKRQKAADEVYGWLMKRQRREEIQDASQVPIHEQAREVLAGLQSGEIYFIVQDQDEMQEPVKARKLAVRVTRSRDRIAVALAVRSDASKEQLLEEGDGQLRKLFEFHRATEGRRDDRLFVEDKAIIHVKGIGAFPESVEE